jgi:hypothetical protein
MKFFRPFIKTVKNKSKDPSFIKESSSTFVRSLIIRRQHKRRTGSSHLKRKPARREKLKPEKGSDLVFNDFNYKH